jgi:hypothetical protein
MKMTGGRVAREDVTKIIAAKKKGQKPIKFKPGGLHKSTGTPAGKKISAAKHLAAAEGKEGAKAQKQERFYQNVLKKGK